MPKMRCQHISNTALREKIPSSTIPVSYTHLMTFSHMQTIPPLPRSSFTLSSNSYFLTSLLSGFADFLISNGLITPFSSTNTSDVYKRQGGHGSCGDIQIYIVEDFLVLVISEGDVFQRNIHGTEVHGRFAVMLDVYKRQL